MGVKVTSNIKKRLKQIIKNCKKLKVPMSIIATDMKNETLRNFDEQHSYDGENWKKSSRAKKQGGKTLQNTERLYNSFNMKYSGNYARVGTNVKYARALNQGVGKGAYGKRKVYIKPYYRRIYRLTKRGKKSKKSSKIKVKGHNREINIPWGEIQAYRYLGISEDMQIRYREILLKYILRR